MSLVRIEDPRDAEAFCRAARGQGKSIGLVPTMGALHEGHMSLVRRAARENDLVCASIFVNPLQFGEAADFDLYPRDFAADCKMLEEAGAQMAFTGSLGGFFPGQLNAEGTLDPDSMEDPGPCAEGLEGAFRPGHFAGVATIVRRLFEVAQPTRAYFGAKDFQQTLVVRDLALRLGAPEVVVCETLREPSGLARSSRNARLDENAYAQAMFVSRALFAARGLWKSGERRVDTLCSLMEGVLSQGDLEVEYAAVRDPNAWDREPRDGRLECAVALVAARVSGVRLIDNMQL